MIFLLLDVFRSIFLGAFILPPKAPKLLSLALHTEGTKAWLQCLRW